MLRATQMSIYECRSVLLLLLHRIIYVVVVVVVVGNSSAVTGCYPPPLSYTSLYMCCICMCFIPKFLNVEFSLNDVLFSRGNPDVLIKL